MEGKEPGLMLKVEDTILAVIDVQEKLTRVMHEKEKLIENLQKLVKGAQILGLPIILTEQNPKGLGLTVPEVVSLIPDIKPISKFSFSCCDVELFLKELKASKRKQVLLTGIETHVCVYQTALDLLSAGYEVQVVADCVSSRTLENKQIALQRMINEGARITSTEMALFELLRVAEGEKFKELLKIVK